MLIRHIGERVGVWTVEEYGREIWYEIVQINLFKIMLTEECLSEG